MKFENAIEETVERESCRREREGVCLLRRTEKCESSRRRERSEGERFLGRVSECKLVRKGSWRVERRMAKKRAAEKNLAGGSKEKKDERETRSK